MKKKILLNSLLVALIALAISFQIVLAHETVTVGDYEIEIGWVNETSDCRPTERCRRECHEGGQQFGSTTSGRCFRADG